MLSMPPDNTTSAEPALIMSCASIVAFMPEPQTLLMVVAPVGSGSLAPRAAWRAGAWPCPAGSTQPKNTSSIFSGDNLPRSSAAPMTWEPSACALNGDNSPMKRPKGVRAAETMTTGSEAVAMAVLLNFYGALDYEHHMMQCGICNGTVGLNCREPLLPLPLDKSLHQPLRLAGQEGLPEHADAEVDRLLQRQFLPLPEQGFLRAQGFRRAFEQGGDGMLDRGIESIRLRHHIDQAPGKRGGGVDILRRHDQPAGTAPADQPQQQRGMDH